MSGHCLRNLLALAVALLLSAPANALLFRAYLAPNGADTNPCTLPQPCRLLPAALAAVDSGGEIWILDSANYNTGTVNVAKSVTILAIPGVVGSVVAAGGDAIDVATGGVELTLRNIVIVPLPGGGGVNGINMTAGATLTLENCLIANIPQAGIIVNAGANVRVNDTTIRDGGTYGLRLEGGAYATVLRAVISGNTFTGVMVVGSDTNITQAHIAGSMIDGNANGVQASSSVATGIVKVSVRDSQIIRNATFGLHAQSTAGAAVTLTASNNAIAQNFTGVRGSGAGAKVMVSGNAVSDNFYGFDNVGALFESSGNNTVRNNSVGVNGTVTPVPME